MILAVNVVASGTTDVGGHSILPTFKLIGSTAVKYMVTVCPAAAQGILSPSYEITIIERNRPLVTKRTGRAVSLTFYDTGFVTRYDPQFLSSLDGTCTHSPRNARGGSRTFEDVRDGKPKW